MQFPTAAQTANLLKIAGIAGCFVGAYYYMRAGDGKTASELFFAGMAVSGIALHANVTGTAVAQVAADVQNIRENPVMPGLPLSRVERTERAAEDLPVPTPAGTVLPLAVILDAIHHQLEEIGARTAGPRPPPAVPTEGACAGCPYPAVTFDGRCALCAPPDQPGPPASVQPTGPEAGPKPLSNSGSSAGRVGFPEKIGVDPTK